MSKKKQLFGALVFNGSEDEGVVLRQAKNTGEPSLFLRINDAKREMSERSIDYGSRTAIVDVRSDKRIIIQTTDEGRTWSVPAKGERSAVPVPA